MKWVVAQLGARMHYAVPRLLAAQGALAHFYTDICAVAGIPRLVGSLPRAIVPNPLLPLVGRVPTGVPLSEITAFTSFGLEYWWRRSRAKSLEETTATHLWAGSRFCDLVLARDFGSAQGVYVFNSAGLELMREARRRGLRTVMEQTIAPRRIERDLLQVEREKFPEWEEVESEDGMLEQFCAREEAEWALADVILCGSEFVRDGIKSRGGPAERCRVVPYGVDARFALPPRTNHGGPLRVLTVGAVGLRKGSPYVLEAARALKGGAHFRMVGPITVTPSAEAKLREHVELVGAVPRTEIVNHYAWADVFLLPSICEGSATATYEALAAGLPVVCTPNSGSVVRHGTEGFVVPTGNAESIVVSLKQLIDAAQRAKFSRMAVARAAEFTLKHYGDRLIGHALRR